MITAAMAILLLAKTDDLVSIEVHGLPVRAAVEAIAKESGADLRVRDDANVNTLVVFAKDVPLDDLLAKVAEATGTEWEVDEKRRTLVTNDKTNAALVARESAWRIASIKKAQGLLPEYAPTDPREIEALVARAEAIGRDLEIWIPTDEQREVIAAIQSKKPIAQLANRVAKSLDAETLATVTVNHPLSFCDRPVGRERRLPSTLQAAFDDYKGEFAVWKEAVLRSAAAFPVKNGEDPRFGVGESSPPAVIHVAAEFLAERSYVRLAVRVADDDGRIVDQWYALLRLEQTGSPLVLEPDETLDVPLSLRETRAYLTSQNTIADDVGVRTLDPSMKSRICSPTTVDPVALGIGPLLVEVGKASKHNLVACVSDFALEWYFLRAAIPLKQGVNSVFADVHGRWEMSATRQADWILIAPKSILEARSKYYDRRALEKLFASQVANRIVSLEDAIEYAGTQPSSLAFRSYEHRVMIRHFRFTGNVNDAHLLHWESEKPLRLVAAMTTAERDQAASGQGIPVSALALPAREAVRKWTEDSGSLFGGFRTAGQADYGAKNLAQLSSRAGVLSSLRLRVVERIEPMTFQLWDELSRETPFADYLAYSGTVFQHATEKTPNVLVQMGVLRKLEVRLELPDGMFVSVSVDQAAAPPGDVWVAPKDLPGDVLEMLRAALEKSRGGGERAAAR